MSPNWPDRPCLDLATEHCRACGRELLRTVEPEGYNDDGQRRYEAWHSCPRYFGRLLIRILTLGIFGDGAGHESHNERAPIMGREWR